MAQHPRLRLVPSRRATISPHSWADDADLRLYRHSIETRTSQLDAMRIQFLHTRTHVGSQIKLLASVLALAWLNLI